MTKATETASRTGTRAPRPDDAATEVKAALTGFIAEITQRMTKQEERLTMLDRTTPPRRPALSTAAGIEAPHQKAFESYLRTGDDDALRGLDLEGKALSTAVAGDGGYLVDPETTETVRSVLTSTASIRKIASVVTVEATSFDVLIDRGDLGSGWSTEAGTVGESGTPSIERISIPLHELSALPKASQRLLDDSAFDIDGWLAGRIAQKFATAEAAAFVTGDGVNKPKGFLTHAAVDQDAWTWGSLGYVATGNAGDFNATNPADPIIDVVYSLGAEYRANATFVLNSKTAGRIRKLKDADGRFIWADGLSAGEPARLLGYPVLVAEDMPDIADGAAAIAFGDFAAGYTVAERPDLRILRDPFSAKPHVLFYATKRVGGDVSDFAAIKLLKFGTS